MGYIIKDYKIINQELMRKLHEIDEDYRNDPYKRETVEDITSEIRNWFLARFREEKQQSQKYNPFEALKEIEKFK